MSKQLPESPNLDHLKEQAKDLLSEFRNGSPDAIERFKANLPALRGQTNPAAYPAKLADAQSVIAREYGCASWAALRDVVVARAAAGNGRPERADALLEALLTGRGAVADQLLREDPALAGFSVFTACAVGDAQAAERFLSADPESANRQGGPRDWEPLLYLCYSAYARERRPAMFQAAQRLLQLGADPNAHWWDAEFPELPETALYGATGRANWPELARLLLDAGANPTDGEALYHSAELPDNDCLRLLLERGANANNTNTLLRKLDFDDLAGARLLLENGVDPHSDGRPALHHAILRRRSVEFLRLLLEFGADLTRTDAAGLTALDLAERLGDQASAEFLVSAGAQPSDNPLQSLLRAALAGDAAGARGVANAHPQLLRDITPENGQDLAALAKLGKTEAVRLLLELGWPPNSLGELSATALHWAAWTGHAEIVRLLLEAGATVDPVEPQYQQRPIGWTQHGSQFCAESPGDGYGEIVETLLDAGSPLPAELHGSEAVMAVYERRGLLNQKS